MNTSVIAIIAVSIGGTLVGAFARPVSRRLAAEVFALGVMFLLFTIARAFWVGVPLDDVIGLLALSGTAETSHYVGAFVIAYAAFLATAILVVRVILARKRHPHEL